MLELWYNLDDSDLTEEPIRGPPSSSGGRSAPSARCSASGSIWVLRLDRSTYGNVFALTVETGHYLGQFGPPIINLTRFITFYDASSLDMLQQIGLHLIKRRADQPM